MYKIKSIITNKCKKCFNYLVQNKTLFISIIFMIIFIILYIYYKNINKKSLYDNLDKSLNPSLSLNSKLDNLIIDSDNFLNITFNNLQNLKNDINIEDDNEKIIVNKYKEIYINSLLPDKLNTHFTTDSTNVNENINNMIINYNNYNKKIEDVLEEINLDLLKQLQKNYGTAHKVNIKRQIDIEDIDSLPQRFT